MLAAWDRMRPALDGLCLSFASTFTEDRPNEAFPPATLRRLREIKARVDPADVFDQNFSVASRSSAPS